MYSSKIWRRTNRLSIVLNEAVSTVVLLCFAPTAIERERCGASSAAKASGSRPSEPHRSLNQSPPCRLREPPEWFAGPAARSFRCTGRPASLSFDRCRREAKQHDGGNRFVEHDR